MPQIEQQAPALTAKAAQTLLRSAMQADYGPAPALSGEAIYRDPFLELTPEEFVFSTPRGIRMHYRKGGRVTVDCPNPDLEGECRLYLWGTVFGAIAWLNHLMPLHCSAVSSKDGVIAFTAPSGGGKSTLAAALSARSEFRHLCDDTLVLAEDYGVPMALPDGKPLKLWADALDLVGLHASEQIGPLPGKFYAQAVSPATQPAPLCDLIVLAEGNEVSLAPITGANKLEQLGKAIYRGHIHGALNRQALHARYMLLIAGKVRFWQLERPLDPARFAATHDEIARLIGQHGLGQDPVTEV